MTPAPEFAFHRRMWESKQRVYRAASILTGLACIFTSLGVLAYDSSFLPLLTTIPALGVCGWAYVRLADVSAVRRVEQTVVASIAAFLLVGDLLNLVTRRLPAQVDVLTHGPILMFLCILCCLALAPRTATRWMVAVWLGHGILNWTNLLRFDWQGLHTAEVSRDLVTLVAIGLLTLLNRYHSVARASLASNQDLRTLALTDDLTGLPNRRAMYSQLALRDGRLAVVMIDLDNFKKVNDSAGHERGDQVLRSLALILDDEAAADGVVGRWGGEEFVVVLDGRDLGRANKLAESMRTRIAAHAGLEGVTLSVGVTNQRVGERTTSVLRRADELMYAAKSAGKNQVQIRA